MSIKGKETTLAAQYVLAAGERQSNVDDLGLDKAGINASGGAIAVNRMMETKVSGLFAANATATILGERNGFVKVVTETKYGQIPGVHIISPHAADLIQEATLAMRLEVTSQEVASTIHTHPTLSEALMEAALDVTGETLHFMPANK